MIDVGQAKVGDIIEWKGDRARVLKIERHRTIDDEHEVLSVDWGTAKSLFHIPESEATLIKSNEKKIKIGAYYKFNSKEDYIDFLETAEKEGFEWSSGQKPTDKDCISYYNGRVYFYIAVDKDYYLSYGNDSLTYSTATWWTRKTLTGIATTMIVCDDEIRWNKNDFNTRYKEMTRLKKNEYDALYKGDFKEMKIIINEPAVVLIKNGKKYVSKAHDEEFDAEKGLLMCLAKSNGISHLDLKRMLKSAAVQNKKVDKKKTENKNSVDDLCAKISEAKEFLYKQVETKPCEYKTIVSPKGRHRGKPFYFYVGDKVIVRDCDYYKNTTNAKAKALLNHIYEIQEDKSDFAGTVYVVNGVEFSGSELEPAKE